MNSLNFTDQYTDEVSCKAQRKALRDKEGVVCRHCGCIILFVLLVGWSCQTQTDEEQKEEIEQGEVVDEIEDISEPPCDEKWDATSDSNECDLYYYVPASIWDKGPTYFCGKFRKEYLCDILDSNWLYVGFYIEVSNAEIMDFLNQTKLFEPIDENEIYRQDFTHPIYESWDIPQMSVLWIKTEDPKTYAQLNEIILSLKKSPLVRMAELSFCFYPPTCTYTTTFSYEFVVKVRDKNDLSDLYALMEETKTWITYHDADHAAIFSIGTDKNSKGNAMQMANYFMETGKFDSARPQTHSLGPVFIGR